jgi:hypothetical protein
MSLHDEREHLGSKNPVPERERQLLRKGLAEHLHAFATVARPLHLEFVTIKVNKVIAETEGLIVPPLVGG